MTDFLRRHASRLLALVLAGGLLGFARLPALPAAERAELAARFAFSQAALPEIPGAPLRSRRPVHPSLEGHAGWISAVGAAVALADLDGDGLANDSCHVDTRSDLVIVSALPGAPGADRFAAFALPEPPGYDRRTMAPMGCIPRDLDEDGSQDLFVYYWGRPPALYLRQPGAVPEPARYAASDFAAPEQRWFTNAVTFADFDGDGHLDVVVANYFQDGARILDARGAGRESMQHSMSRAFNGGGNRIYLGTPAGVGSPPRYREVTGVLDAEARQAWTLAVGAADLDGDLRPELYFANDFGPDRLYHNRSEPGRLELVGAEGRRGFATPRSKVLGRDSFKGMGVDFSDVNGDGRLDFFVSNIAAEYALEESHFLWLSGGDDARASFASGRAPYTDESERLGVSRSGWGWDTRFGDFDNDGRAEALQATGFVRGTTNRWPELQELATGNDELLALPGSWLRVKAGDDLSGHQVNPFYVESASGRFFDLAAELSLDAPHVTRGIATADVDGDGDLDFAIANQWDRSLLYRNESPRPGAFLGVRPLLPAAQPGSWRPAIGAEVRILAEGPRVRVAQVDGGNGHSGVRSPELHFGLGDWPAGEKVPLLVRWRDAAGLHEERAELAPGWHALHLGGSPGASQDASAAALPGVSPGASPGESS